MVTIPVLVHPHAFFVIQTNVIKDRVERTVRHTLEEKHTNYASDDYFLLLILYNKLVHLNECGHSTLENAPGSGDTTIGDKDKPVEKISDDIKCSNGGTQ